MTNAVQIIPFLGFGNVSTAICETLIGKSALRNASTYTGQHKHRGNTHKESQAPSGIRTHQSSGQAAKAPDCTATTNSYYLTLLLTTQNLHE
jgi:hypothetical protein